LGKNVTGFLPWNWNGEATVDKLKIGVLLSFWCMSHWVPWFWTGQICGKIVPLNLVNNYFCPSPLGAKQFQIIFLCSVQFCSTHQTHPKGFTTHIIVCRKSQSSSKRKKKTQIIVLQNVCHLKKLVEYPFGERDTDK